ncbi:MAG: hypothetical protein ACLR4X_02455 [Clostridia bacterium]
MESLQEKVHSVPKEKDRQGGFIKKHKSIIIIIAVLIIAFGSIAVVLYNNNRLTEDEKMVAKVVKTYHDNLKNPDSMQIFEIRIYNNEEKNMKMILMDTSGQNGFGGSTRNVVAYTSDIKYLGDDSKADTKITKYTSDSESNEIVVSKIIYETWYNEGKYIYLGTNEYTSIDVNKILKNYEKIK